MGKKKRRKIWIKLVALRAGKWIKDVVSDKDLLEDIVQGLLSIALVVIRSGLFPPGAPLLLVEKPLKELIDKIDGKEG
jgi:hypothetical protein